jgi:hypothetical protein
LAKRTYINPNTGQPYTTDDEPKKDASKGPALGENEKLQSTDSGRAKSQEQVQAEGGLGALAARAKRKREQTAADAAKALAKGSK